MSRKKGRKLLVRCMNLCLVIAVIYGIFCFSLQKIGAELDFCFLFTYRKRILDGFIMTLTLSLASFVCSLLIGGLCAVGRNSRILAVRYFCSMYVHFIRGTPLIMQIYLFFYIIGTAWGIENRFLAGVIILSVFEGAYIAEIIRGSLAAIAVSQREVAMAVGFDRRQTLLYFLLPQLIEGTLPALTGQLASLIKDSSLLSMIAVIELMQTMREITALNFKMFESYLFLGVLYLCLTIPLSFVSKWLERRFRYEN